MLPGTHYGRALTNHQIRATKRQIFSKITEGNYNPVVDTND